MRKLAVLPLVGLLAVAACVQDAPTAPLADESAASAAPTGISASVSGVSTQVLNFDADLDGITGRVLPGFEDAEAAEALRGYIEELKAQLAADDRSEVARVVQLARAELTPGRASIGDLGYIELVLDNIDRAIAK
jgi:hypothetical protein